MLFKLLLCTHVTYWHTQFLPQVLDCGQSSLIWLSSYSISNCTSMLPRRNTPCYSSGVVWFWFYFSSRVRGGSGLIVVANSKIGNCPFLMWIANSYGIHRFSYYSVWRLNSNSRTNGGFCILSVVSPHKVRFEIDTPCWQVVIRQHLSISDPPETRNNSIEQNPISDGGIIVLFTPKAALFFFLILPCEGICRASDRVWSFSPCLLTNTYIYIIP